MEDSSDSQTEKSEPSDSEEEGDDEDGAIVDESWKDTDL